MRKSTVLLVALALLCLPRIVAAGDPPETVRGTMNEVYLSFTKLQPYIHQRDSFTAPENEKTISGLLDVLGGSFTHVRSVQGGRGNDPGFTSTLATMTDMLGDARNRFKEGKKEYALWRVRTATQYCYSCHTRYEVKADFTGRSADLSSLSTYEKGEFYLATRQFELARETYLAFIQAPDDPMHRIDALRRLLVIYTRVDPDPRRAITDFTRIRSSVSLARYEDEEVKGWLESLRRWQNESVGSHVDPLAKAEALVRQGIAGSDDLLGGSKNTVELLRATSILHKIFEGNDVNFAKKRPHILYLLGLAYSELPFLFVSELPEMFLEQCIRESPATDEARKSYRLYRDVITSQYTGSGGTSLPAEVLLQFKELHDLAYGVVPLGGRV